MRGKIRVRKKIASWIMTFVMMAGVVMVPAGKVHALSVGETSANVTATVTESNVDGSYHEYFLKIDNKSSVAIKDWLVEIPVSGITSAQDWSSWSKVKVSYTDSYLYLTPTASSDKTINPGGSFGSTTEGSYKFNYMASSIVSSPVVYYSTTEGAFDEIIADADTAGGNSGGGSEEYAGGEEYELPEDCIDDATTTPFDIHGKLHLDMNSLKINDANGNPFQLRGISSHGINWGGDNGEYQNEYINYSSIKKTRDILNANAIRLAMYTDEYNGYTTGGNKSNLKWRVDKGVQCATALGMYAIVDWHILNSNPKTHINEAKEFWEYASDRYSDYDNVLYEICNEPTSGIWSDIKEYAETIIPIIRKNDPDAIIIVGTPTWSQDVDIAMNAPLKDLDGTLMDNVMYTIHFYANTHGASFWEKMKTAWNTIPIFCTEFGMCASSGNGTNDFTTASTWLNLMDEHCISYFVWNLSETPETSALMKSGKAAYDTWTESNLSESGVWIKEQYTARKDVNNTIPENNDPDQPVLSDIDLSKDNMNMEKGSTAKVSDKTTADVIVTPLPEGASLGALSFSSSKTSVATVDKSGVITAISAGTAVITVQSGEITKTFLVTVGVTPTGISLDKPAVSLTITGDSKSEVVTASVIPKDATDNTIVWSVEPEDIVDIDENGASVTVTAKKNGKAAVTAAIKGYPNLKATCNIAVSASVGSVNLDKEELTLVTTDDPVQLIPTIDVDGGSYEYAWGSSDEKIVTVDQEGNVKAVGDGTASVTVSAGGKEAQCTVTSILPISNVVMKKGDTELSATEEGGLPEVELSVDDEAAFGVNVYPEGATGRDEVSWNITGSNDIVSIDETGKIKALKVGETTIQVTVGKDITISGENERIVYNTKTASVKITVKDKPADIPQNPVKDPYEIDLGKLSGGVNYFDDTYLKSLYVKDEADTKTYIATLKDGVLTLLPGRNYKLTGKNDTLTVSLKQVDSTAADNNKSVVLENAAVKNISTEAAVNIKGDTTVKEDINADNVTIDAKDSNVNIGGNVAAGDIVINSGTVTVNKAVDSSKDIDVSGGSLTVGKGIKADNSVSISGGSVTVAGTDKNAAISAKNVNLTAGEINATGGEGTSAIAAKEAVTVGSNGKLSVNSKKKNDGSMASAISGTTITVEDGATITSDDNSKTDLFSVTPKDQTGTDVDITKYTGENNNSGSNSNSSGDNGNGNSSDNSNGASNNNQQNQKDNTSSQQAGQTQGQQADGSTPASTVIKAADMTIKANVKAVEGISLSGTYQLAAKKSMMLFAAFSPEGAAEENITVTSSAPNIVSVSGTKLTAKKAGTAKITVTSQNGLIKTFNVKVMKKAVSRIKIKASKKSIKVGKTVKLKVTITPYKKKASAKIYWKSSDESVATVTQKGVVKGIKKGKVKISATALDGSGKTKTVKLTVK